jgi:hypothetical protein
LKKVALILGVVSLALCFSSVALADPTGNAELDACLHNAAALAYADMQNTIEQIPGTEPGTAGALYCSWTENIGDDPNPDIHNQEWHEAGFGIYVNEGDLPPDYPDYASLFADQSACSFFAGATCQDSAEQNGIDDVSASHFGATGTFTDNGVTYYTFATKPGFGIDYPTGQTVVASSGMGTYPVTNFSSLGVHVFSIGQGGNGPDIPSIPIGEYADSLLSGISESFSTILPYAAAVTAFLIGILLIRKWIGRRKATEI